MARPVKGQERTYSKIGCQICGRVFTSKLSDQYLSNHIDLKPRFCSLGCMQLWRRVPKVEVTCEICGKKKLFDRSQVKYKGHGKYCSKICSGKAYSAKFSGENHPFYKGDRAMDRKFRTDGQSYRKWRKAVLKRDDDTCIWCKSTENLEVDHIRPKSLFPELAFDINNGRTLCHDCHTKTPTYAKNMTREQFDLL